MFEVVENSEKKLVVSCKIPPKKYGTEKDVHIDLSNVIAYVVDQNIDLGPGSWTRCATLYNYTKSPRLEEEFVFERKKVQKISLTQTLESDIVTISEIETPTVTKKRVRRSARKSANTISAKED